MLIKILFYIASEEKMQGPRLESLQTPQKQIPIDYSYNSFSLQMDVLAKNIEMNTEKNPCNTPEFTERKHQPDNLEDGINIDLKIQSTIKEQTPEYIQIQIHKSSTNYQEEENLDQKDKTEELMPNNINLPSKIEVQNNSMERKFSINLQKVPCDNKKSKKKCGCF